MPEIDLTSPEEIRLTVSDHSALRELLTHRYELPPDDIRTIANALCADRGITLDEFAHLLMNAAVNGVRHNLYYRHLPCNVNPACISPLGHDGECDTDLPF